jgi:hypothetical protein
MEICRRIANGELLGGRQEHPPRPSDADPPGDQGLEARIIPDDLLMAAVQKGMLATDAMAARLDTFTAAWGILGKAPIDNTLADHDKTPGAVIA